MNVMICFDVNEKLDQLKKELASNGYMSSWRVKRGKDEITYYLPSNCMWKKGENMSPGKAKEELKKATSQIGIKTIRSIAMVVGKFDGMTGVPSMESGGEVASEVATDEGFSSEA